MVDLIQTTNAGADGTGHLDFEQIAAGLVWVVPQMSVETVPFRQGATCTIRRNGSFITSTILGSGDSAYGPPAIVMNRGDHVTMDWAGLTAGDQCIGTLWYNEQTWNANPDPATQV